MSQNCEIPKPEWMNDSTWSFHKKNPHVYDLFKRFAFKVIDGGHQHFSSKAIFERIRWETLINTRGSKFKLQNNHTPYYARLFMHDFPQYDGFFRTREIKNEIPK